MGESGGVRKIFRTERISILLGAVVGVVACAEVQVGAHAVKSSTTLSDPAGETALAPVQVATDAEGYALWSGFRTRDGAWIAHPMLPAPSRAYVRNPINGRVIEADLLRRDPSTPGPMILLSAEAARALEIGPHRLTKVQIEVIEDTIPDSALAVAATAEVPSPAPTAAVSEDALTPIETVEAAPPTGEGAPAPASDGSPQVLAEIPAEAAPEASPAAAPEVPTTQPAAAPEGPAPAPRVLAEIPAEPAPARPAPVAEATAPSAPQQTAAAPESPQTSSQPSSGVFRGDAPYELGGASGGGDLAAAPAQPAPALSAPAAPAPAAQSAPQAQPARVATTPAAPPVAAPVAPPAAAASGAQKFVQVVSFTAEGSAAELATRLNALGQPALTDSALAGETRWHRVLIGPLRGEAATESALQAARELGYGDAFVTIRDSGAPQAAARPVPASPAPTPAAQPAQAAEKPYVQVGSYKLEDNARAAVQHLKDQGLPSFTNSGGSDWHRVLIGPLEGAEAVDQALDAARALGHSDAYVTRF